MPARSHSFGGVLRRALDLACQVISCVNLDLIKSRLVIALLVLVAGGWAQTARTKTPLETTDSDANRWSFTAAAYGYVAPNEDSYFNPIVTADHRSLHLEARYNYEDQRTGSLWAGYNFRVGRKLVFQATPMLGAVFGNTAGVAPGYEMSLFYKRLWLYSEGEYVFDFKTKTGNFFYDWNELDFAVTNWFYAGLAEQRTLAFQTALDTRRGLAAGFSRKKMYFTVYFFNIGGRDPTVVLGLGARF